MLKKNLTGLVIASLFVVLAVAFVVRRKMPPYELGLHSVEAHMTAEASGGPHIGNCPIFPVDNIWNTPIDTLPKLAKSDAYIASIGAKKIHPDFGSNLSYGIPYTEIPPNTREVPVSFEYAEDSDPGPYPIPRDAPIEGGADTGGDRHVLLVDSHKCILYELYHAAPQKDGSWTAGSGIKMNLNSNDLRPDGKTSADAAGLPILPGLVRYDEVTSGEINHALRFTLPRTRNTYVWPARHKASSNADKNLPPLGTRFRLRADFDISEFSLNDRVILKALKKYGMFLADNGSAIFLSGVSDKRWNNDDLRRLGEVSAEDLEAVDEVDLQVSNDSARAKKH
jgi:hypothetical protein